MSQEFRVDRIAFEVFNLDEALPNLLRWLGDPDVQPWYDAGELTQENLRCRFSPRDGIHCYTIVIEKRSVGYIQAYRIGVEPEYQRQIDADPDAVAIDLFIGEAEYRNAGWGTEALLAFVDRIVFGKMNASLAMIAPDPLNARAVRCYEKVGFQPIETVHVVDEDYPGNTGNELVMLLPRREFQPRGISDGEK